MELNNIPRTKQEEYVHFLVCIASLQRALKILELLQCETKNPLSEAAFGYALVQYAHPYRGSQNTSNKKLKLKTDHIPKEFIEIHNQLMRDRDKIHAHSDLSVSDIRLRDINKIDGVTYVLMTSNVDLRFERMNRITDILKLINGTLENMNLHKLSLEKHMLSEKSNKNDI